MLKRSRTTKKMLGDRAYVATAPSVWNSLLKHIRKIETLNEFKCYLKKWFCHHYFPVCCWTRSLNLSWFA